MNQRPPRNTASENESARGKSGKPGDPAATSQPPTPNPKDLARGGKRATDLARRLGDKGLLAPTLTFLLCGDESKSKCASAKQMRAAWKALKQGVKARRKASGVAAVAIRTRCLGVCHHGPLIGVQPAGCWYAHCHPETVEQVLQHHLDADAPPPPLRVEGPELQ